MTISHRVDSQQLSGLLGGFVGVDMAFATILGSFSLTRVDLRLTDAPSGGSVVAMVNTVTGGGGSALIQGEVLDGTSFISTTGAVAVTGTTTLYLRVVSESGDAMGLSASVEISFPDAGVVTILLSTLQNVKDSAGVTDTTNDTIIQRHLEGVSQGMRNWMERDITAQVITVERHFPTGLSSGMILNAGPIISVEAVRSGGSVLDSSTYRSEPDRILRRVSGSSRIKWTRDADIEVDYTAGFAAVPADLVDACTQETVRRWLQTVKGAGSGAHVSSNTPETGDTETLLTDGFLPQTIETMKHYRLFS